MSLFRNKNEQAYVGGKKHWTDVLKNSGPADVLLWRMPEEDFNTNSTLIVMPGEEAIFVNGGIIEQVFPAGTYKLSTENYPFISRLRNMLSGGVSIFNCVVYFVRKAHGYEVLWGTDSPIQVRDKVLGIATQVRARGAYKVQVEDGPLFLEKMVGGKVAVTSQEALGDYFCREFQSKIRSTIAQYLQAREEELLGIDAMANEIARQLEPEIDAILKPYGLTCVTFSISAMDIVGDELRKKYDEIGMDAIKKMRMAAADKKTIDILGDDWTRVQTADIMKTFASNEGAGGMTVAAMGMNMANSMGNLMGGMMPQQEKPTSPIEKIKQLKELLDIGVLTQEEFDKKKAELLKDF